MSVWGGEIQRMRAMLAKAPPTATAAAAKSEPGTRDGSARLAEATCPRRSASQLARAASVAALKPRPWDTASAAARVAAAARAGSCPRLDVTQSYQPRVQAFGHGLKSVVPVPLDRWMHARPLAVRTGVLREPASNYFTASLPAD